MSKESPCGKILFPAENSPATLKFPQNITITIMKGGNGLFLQERTYSLGTPN